MGDAGPPFQPLYCELIEGYLDRKRSFLCGIPLVSREARARKDIKRQLALRDNSVLSAWAPESALLDCHHRVAELIRGYFGWPNTHFLPDDPCELLFYCQESDMIVVEFLCVVDDEFGSDTDAVDDVYHMKYAEFLECLVNGQRPPDSEVET